MRRYATLCALPLCVLWSVAAGQPAGLGTQAAAFVPGEMPPYGVARFAMWTSWADPKCREVLVKSRCTLLEVGGFTRCCAGPWDRKELKSRIGRARKQVQELHDNRMTVTCYVTYHPVCGDPQERTRFWDFYDKRWDTYKDYLGPKPADPIEWCKIDADAKPRKFHYTDWMKGYYICPNNPYWLQYLNGIIRLTVEAGYDGIRYDGPVGPCFCKFCQKAFREYLRGKYTRGQLQEFYGFKSFDDVRIPREKADRLQVEWRRYCCVREGTTVAQTRAFARKLNPKFLMSYNYCIGGASLCGSSRFEALAAAGDYALIEGDQMSTPRLTPGGKQSVLPDCKYLLAASDGKPVELCYYVAPSRRRSKEPPPLGTFYPPNLVRLAMAAGMAGGCPWKLGFDRNHEESRRAAMHYGDFFFRQERRLARAQTYASVAVLASLHQHCAAFESFPLSVSRILVDAHVPHVMLIDSDVTAEKLEDFRVVILPQTPALSRAQAAALIAVVRAGGSLIAIGECGTHDDHARKLPNNALAALGHGGPVRHGTGIAIREPGRGKMVSIPDARLPRRGRMPIAAAAKQPMSRLAETVDSCARYTLDGYFSGSDRIEYNLMSSPDGKNVLLHVLNVSVGEDDNVRPEGPLAAKVLLPHGLTARKVTAVSPDAKPEEVQLAFKQAVFGTGSYVLFQIPPVHIYTLVVVECDRSSGARASRAAAHRLIALSAGPTVAPGDESTIAVWFAADGMGPVRKGAFSLDLPKGWDVVKKQEDTFGELPAGRRAGARFTVRAPGDLKAGALCILAAACSVELAGGEKRVVQDAVFVRGSDPIALHVRLPPHANTMTGENLVDAEIKNATSLPVTGRLSYSLPPGWRADPPEAKAAAPPRATAKLSALVRSPREVTEKRLDVSAAFDYVLAGAARRATWAGTLRIPERFMGVVCSKTRKPPVLDGFLDDACWQTAREIGNFQLNTGAGPAKQQTQARVAYDDGSLYLAMQCLDARMDTLVARLKEHGSDLWKDDSVELWFDVKHDHTSWVQLVTNSLAAKYPAHHRWSVSARRGENGWIVEAAIPFETLGSRPRPGQVWGFNPCRTRIERADAPAEFSSWSCIHGYFKQPARFGHLVFR